MSDSDELGFMPELIDGKMVRTTRYKALVQANPGMVAVVVQADEAAKQYVIHFMDVLFWVAIEGRKSDRLCGVVAGDSGLLLADEVSGFLLYSTPKDTGKYPLGAYARVCNGVLLADRRPLPEIVNALRELKAFGGGWLERALAPVKGVFLRDGGAEWLSDRIPGELWEEFGIK